MYKHSHILIGSKLNEVLGRNGQYAVQFMSVTLTYENADSAVQAYNNIEGEAYIWDISQYKKSVLVEAKLLKKDSKTDT